MVNAGPPPAGRQLLVGSITLVAVIAIAAVSSSGLSEPKKAILNSLSAGLGGFLTLVNEFMEERRQSKERRFSDLQAHAIAGRPLRLMIGLGLVLVFIERLILLMVGVFVALYQVLLGDPASLEDVVGFVLAIGFPVGVPVVAIISIFLARYVGHRIATYPLLWIVGGLLIHMAADMALLALVFNLLDVPLDAGAIAKAYVVFFILEAVACLVGSYWAERERLHYLMSRVYKKMTPSDQEDLAQLALTDPRFH